MTHSVLRADTQWASDWAALLGPRASAHWLPPGFEIIGSIDSTNSELVRRGRAGQLHPQALWALQQTAGRGRLGREWHARADAGTLCFSIGLMLAPADWRGLSLVVGLAICEVLEKQLGLQAHLKWPNDVYLRRQTSADAIETSKPASAWNKLAGILLETISVNEAALVPELQSQRARWLVVGVGINLLSPTNSDLRTPAVGCLSGQATPQEIQGIARELFYACVMRISADVLRFEAQGFAPFVAAYQARDVLLRQSVQLSDGRCGTGMGVNAVGEYQLRNNPPGADSAGVWTVQSEEISLRVL